jgi:hypothetical protein
MSSFQANPAAREAYSSSFRLINHDLQPIFIPETMKSNIVSPLFLLLIIAIAPAKAQTNVGVQLNSIPVNFSSYTECYLADLTHHQGFTFLNNLNTTGDVLKQWELSLSLRMGLGLSTDVVNPNFSDNFILTGPAPSLFGTQQPGELVFRFLDEGTGVPLVNPFTGDNLGFSLPLFPGIGTTVGFSPSILPVLNLGIGYGTEVAVGVLPGALMLATKGISNSFSLSRDIMAAFAVRHDVLHWVPLLHDKKFYLTLGIDYSMVGIGVEIGPDLIGNIEAPSTDKIQVTNNLKGIDFSSSNLSFEAVLTKKFGFLDLSLFTSLNTSAYKVATDGGIDIRIAKDFYSSIEQGSDSYSLTPLVDLNKKMSQFIYGLALQFNFGRFNLALKAAPFNDQFYTFGLGYKILKEKK